MAKEKATVKKRGGARLGAGRKRKVFHMAKCKCATCERMRS